MQSLIRMIQKAHGAELGAINAYRGHWRSLPIHSKDAKKLSEIIDDEINHRDTLRSLLTAHKSKPSVLYDTFYSTVGLVLGKLCGVMGYRIPMMVAKIMETMGAVGYGKMAYHAHIIGHLDLFILFIDMSKQEKKHEEFFKKVLRKK